MLVAINRFDSLLYLLSALLPKVGGEPALSSGQPAAFVGLAYSTFSAFRIEPCLATVESSHNEYAQLRKRKAASIQLSSFPAMLSC